MREKVVQDQGRPRALGVGGTHAHMLSLPSNTMNVLRWGGSDARFAAAHPCPAGRIIAHSPAVAESRGIPSSLVPWLGPKAALGLTNDHWCAVMDSVILPLGVPKDTVERGERRERLMNHAP